MENSEKTFLSKINNIPIGFLIESKYDINQDEIYGFVEGCEDKIFYIDLYEKSIGKKINITQCNGVDYVEGCYSYVMQNQTQYDLKRFAFFRDRDYSNEQTKGRKYVTPCYSLENLCLNRYTLEKFLTSRLNDIAKNDLELIMKKYIQAEKDYLESISHINAFLWCRYEDKTQTKSREIKSIDDVLGSIFNKKYISFDDNLQLYEKTKMHFKTKDLNFLTKEFEYQLKSMDKYESRQNILNIECYRGKFILPFFISFLKKMIETLSTKKITEKKYKIKDNIRTNELEQFFPYTKIPECLFNFIRNGEK